MDVNYKWNLSETNFTKDKGNVLSCFSCAGGSTMGYKLSGFNVIGCNDIDPKMMATYIANHNPKYSYLESITTFKNRIDLPAEFYNLDILDGSPPCSSFSLAGKREEDWGKEKKFREGQSKQVLDTLFFDFIDLAKRLQPKIVVAENVKGLLLGNAKQYVRKIYKEFDRAGYYTQHFLLDSSKMGIPQKRERVFFICMRKDIAFPFLKQIDLFTEIPEIKFSFEERQIIYSEIEEKGAKEGEGKMYPSLIEMWDRTEVGGQMYRVSGHKAISHYKLNPEKVLHTIIASEGAGAFHHKVKRTLTKKEMCKAGSFPLDFNFCGNKIKYIVGMSVPPLMTARISKEIYSQWLSKL